MVTQAWSELQRVIPELSRIIRVWKELHGREESRIIPLRGSDWVSSGTHFRSKK